MKFLIGLIIGIGLVISFQTSAEHQPEIRTVIETKTVFINVIKHKEIRVNQTEPMLMETTAFTAGFESTGKHPDHPLYGITATGTKAKRGVCAVDETLIPMGTSLYVEGYGYCKAEDRGSAIKGYKVDVFIPSLDEALEFGREQRKVWILEGWETNEAG